MLRNILLWRYGRTTWQYDVLCVLILAFVFLTPKSWFDGERERSRAHRNGLDSVTLVVPPDAPFDNREIERRVRDLPGRGGAQVRDIRPVRDAGGRVVAYEVDLK